MNPAKLRIPGGGDSQGGAQATPRPRSALPHARQGRHRVFRLCAMAGVAPAPLRRSADAAVVTRVAAPRRQDAMLAMDGKTIDGQAVSVTKAGPKPNYKAENREVVSQARAGGRARPGAAGRGEGPWGRRPLLEGGSGGPSPTSYVKARSVGTCDSAHICARTRRQGVSFGAAQMVALVRRDLVIARAHSPDPRAFRVRRRPCASLKGREHPPRARARVWGVFLPMGILDIGSGVAPNAVGKGNVVLVCVCV